MNMMGRVPPVPPAPITCEADRLVWELGGIDGSDRKWRSEIFSRFPNSLSTALAKAYSEKWDKDGRREANLWLLDISENTNSQLINIALSEDAISYIAELKAKKCHRIKQMSKSDEAIYKELINEVSRMGVKQPKLTQNRTHRSIIKRFICKRWWRRQLRKASARSFEALAIEHGLVHKNSSIYVSNPIYMRFKDQHQRNIETLSKLEAVNEQNDELELLELVARSLANPKNRRSELMARFEGIDHLAKCYGHEGLFLTITCPSKYHSRFSRSGDKNPNYQGYTPRQAQQYLTKLWAKIRAELARQGIKTYGFRIAEPHHDGTPHWHLLLFTDPEQAQALIDVCRTYAMAENSNEKGADLHRYKVERINRTKGSAVAYVAKYISKAIDGFGIDKDLYGQDSKASAQKIVVWAKLWGIRQFQQIGGPSVGVWRELRRLNERPEGIMGSAYAAADLGDWAGYVQAMGGPFCSKNEQKVRLAKLSPSDHETGEIRLNQYMEPASDQVYGVEADGDSICTRHHIWTIQTKSIGQSTYQYEAYKEISIKGFSTYWSNGRDGPLEFCQ